MSVGNLIKRDRGLELRAGNKPLSYLLTIRSLSTPGLEQAIDCIPSLAKELVRDARTVAGNLLHCKNHSSISHICAILAAALQLKSTKLKALTNSIFDLQLTVLFGELTRCFNDNVIASILVDAVLYQGTGCLAASPTEQEVWDLGTKDVRGIHKFRRASELMPGLKDIDSAAWVFGKEYSAIVSDNPKDLANIVAVAPLSFQLRAEAKWRIRNLLYGELPTVAATKNLDATVRSLEKEIMAAFRRPVCT
jgi:hypothetical protein